MAKPKQATAKMDPQSVIDASRQAIKADPSMGANVKKLYETAIAKAQARLLARESGGTNFANAQLNQESKTVER